MFFLGQKINNYYEQTCLINNPILVRKVINNSTILHAEINNFKTIAVSRTKQHLTGVHLYQLCLLLYHFTILLTSSVPQCSQFMYKNNCDSKLVGKNPFRRFVIECPAIEKKRSHILDVSY